MELKLYVFAVLMNSAAGRRHPAQAQEADRPPEAGLWVFRNLDNFKLPLVGFRV